eukprot:2644257-Amphidinium_carterae.1
MELYRIVCVCAHLVAIEAVGDSGVPCSPAPPKLSAEVRGNSVEACQRYVSTSFLCPRSLDNVLHHSNLKFLDSIAVMVDHSP